MFVLAQEETRWFKCCLASANIKQPSCSFAALCLLMKSTAWPSERARFLFKVKHGRESIVASRKWPCEPLLNAPLPLGEPTAIWLDEV